MDGAAAPVVISPADALARKLTRYFTGRPCIHGHVCERSVFDNACMECKRVRWTRYPAKERSGPARQRESCFGPNLPEEVARWPDDGGAKRVTTVNPVSGRTSKAGWTRCLSRSSEKPPHRFFSEDICRVRVCVSCRQGAEKAHFNWPE